METVISVFPVKEEPELNILSDGDDDTRYDNGEDEENVTISHYSTGVIFSVFITFFAVQSKRNVPRVLSYQHKLRAIYQGLRQIKNSIVPVLFVLEVL